MKFHKALKIIINQYGKEQIKNEYLINFLADYHAFEVKSSKRIIEAFLQLGYGDEIFQIDATNHANKLLKIQQFSNELINNQGFQEEQVLYVINSIKYSLGWVNEEPEPPTSEHVDLECTNINQEIQVNGCYFDMVYVKGGSFDMGGTPEQGLFASYDEKPSVEISIKDFYIAKTAVTQ